MTTERTHGPCTIGHAWGEHTPDCPSLYPAQQEPDALTRLVRLIREHCKHGFPQEGFPESGALSLISEARAEMGDLRNRAEKAEDAVRRVTQILEDAVRGGQ